MPKYTTKLIIGYKVGIINENPSIRTHEINWKNMQMDDF